MPSGGRLKIQKSSSREWAFQANIREGKRVMSSAEAPSPRLAKIPLITLKRYENISSHRPRYCDHHFEASCARRVART